MGMSTRKRYWLVLFAVLAVVAVVVLSSGLSTLELGAGRPLPRMPSAEEELATPTPPSATRVVSLVLRVLLMVSAALLPFSIIYYIFSPEARKRVLRDLITILSILLPLYFLYRARSDTLETFDEVPLAPGPPAELPSVPEASFTADPSQGLVLLANIGLALFLATLLVGLAWILWRRRRRSSMPLDKLAQEAEHAVQAIEAGADLRDTVTRCYFDMMQILKEERGIHRQRAMTPREFEAGLEKAGIPTTQVRRLTRLFEEVRYGNKQLGQREERQAVISLTSIVRFCRSAS